MSSANPKRSEGSAANYTNRTLVSSLIANPNVVRVRARTGALTTDRARTGSMDRQSETLAPDLNAVRVHSRKRPHKAPSQGIGRELGTHERSRPDSKHRTTGCNVWPGPERSDGPAFGHGPRVSSANPNAVRVRPRTISMCPDWVGLTANPNMVRVRAWTGSVSQRPECYART